ncbi:MAG: antiterminator LoaP [Clostridia bacterium]|nr:antiterminator LoaP [Clostridia bacterium]
MQEPYWWYVLYVRTNTEHRVVKSFQHAIMKKGLPYEFETFCPESEQYYNNKKARILGKQYLKRPMFSNYVFVETNMPAMEFRIAVFEIIYDSSDIIRLLTLGKSGEIAIKDEERKRLEYLLRSKRCLEHSVGYIEGDKIVITGGPLVGQEGNIKKVNRHHRSALIEIDMFNQKQLVDVALEVIKKE